MSSEMLQKILDVGDEEACFSFFYGMKDSDRASYSEQSLKWVKKIARDSVIELNPNSWGRNPLLPAAQIASFSSVNFSELNKLPWVGTPRGDREYTILVDRNPEWIQKWIMKKLEADTSAFRVARKLLEDGLITQPDHPNYNLGLIDNWDWNELNDDQYGRRRDDENCIEKAICADPHLQNIFWKLFEIEGGGDLSLAKYDINSGVACWGKTVLALSEKGVFPRERLFQSCMDALRRDFNHYRAKWFLSLFDNLKPTDEEEKQYAQSYLQLLTMTAPNIVTWSFKKIEKQYKIGSYDDSVLITAIQAVLHVRSKGLVKRALKMYMKIVKNTPNLKESIANIVASALTHEATDVQEAVLDVIEMCDPKSCSSFSETLSLYADMVSPSLRKRLQKWLGDGAGSVSGHIEPTQSMGHASLDVDALNADYSKAYSIPLLYENIMNNNFAVPAVAFDGTEIPRLCHQQEICPIQTIEELAEICSSIIEGETDVENIERVFDGFARLGHVRPSDFNELVGPLYKRVEKLLENGMGRPYYDVAFLVHVWVSGVAYSGDTVPDANKVWKLNLHDRQWDKSIEGDYDWLNFGSFTGGLLIRRTLAIATLIESGKSSQLLSAPTHTGGWVDPRILAERICNWTGPDPDVVDVMISLGRLAPEYRNEALAHMHKSKKEWVQVIRYACGSNDKIGKNASLWITAARVRHPWKVDSKILKAFPKIGPDAGEPATYNIEIVKERHWSTLRWDSKLSMKSSPGYCLPVLMQADRLSQKISVGFENDLSVQWQSTLWLGARESYCAAAVIKIAHNMDWCEAEWHNKCCLEVLLESQTPLREMGLLLLVVGLATKEPGEYGLATDAAILAIEDGRLGSDNLGSQLSALMKTELLKPARLAKTLSDVSSISLVHRVVIKLSLEYCLSGDVKGVPRDFAKLLELLYELSIDLDYGIVCVEHRTFLGAFTGSNKSTKAARALLGISCETKGEQMKVGMSQLLTNRIEMVRVIERANSC